MQNGWSVGVKLFEMFGCFNEELRLLLSLFCNLHSQHRFFACTCNDPFSHILTPSVMRTRMCVSLAPNHIWYLDGNDKFKKFGFALHACIDG